MNAYSAQAVDKMNMTNTTMLESTRQAYVKAVQQVVNEEELLEAQRILETQSLAVTTGGRGADEGMEESLCAKEVIVSSGVDPARVMTEEKSTSTQENLLFAREIIEAAGGSRDDSVVIVTSGFHVYRAKKLAASVGFSNVSAKASKDLPYLVPYYYFREYAANLFESVAGHFDETEAE